MNIGFFIVGGVIFAIYIALTIWNIFYSHRKQREENYPNLEKSKTAYVNTPFQVDSGETDNKDGL
jgi:hypothetical protein